MLQLLKSSLDKGQVTPVSTRLRVYEIDIEKINMLSCFSRTAKSAFVNFVVFQEIIHSLDGFILKGQREITDNVLDHESIKKLFWAGNDVI